MLVAGPVAGTFINGDKLNYVSDAMDIVSVVLKFGRSRTASYRFRFQLQRFPHLPLFPRVLECQALFNMQRNPTSPPKDIYEVRREERHR